MLAGTLSTCSTLTTPRLIPPAPLRLDSYLKIKSFPETDAERDLHTTHPPIEGNQEFGDVQRGRAGCSELMAWLAKRAAQLKQARGDEARFRAARVAYALVFSLGEGGRPLFLIS